MIILLSVIFIIIIPNTYSLSVDLVVSDHLGSPATITDSDGNTKWSADYEPFGTTFNENGENNYQYNAKELDKKTGLHNYGARYLNAETARFNSADTLTGNIEDPQTLNRYTYVTNNPMQFIDSSGKLKIRKDLASKFGVFTYDNFIEGETITKINTEWSEKKARNSVLIEQHRLSVYIKNIQNARAIGKEPNSIISKNLIGMIDSIENMFNKYSTLDEVNKAIVIYSAFQNAGLGTATYDRLRASNGDSSYLKSVSDASKISHKYFKILPIHILFEQVEGYRDMNQKQRHIRGGVCRDKAVALATILRYYGLDASVMGYHGKIGTKIYGHAVTIVNFKELGFVGFDPTNYQEPVPLDVPQDYKHLFPVLPRQEDLKPLPINLPASNR